MGSESSFSEIRLRALKLITHLPLAPSWKISENTSLTHTGLKPRREVVFFYKVENEIL